MLGFSPSAACMNYMDLQTQWKLASQAQKGGKIKAVDYIGVILGYIGIILGLHWDYIGLYWDYIGIILDYVDAEAESADLLVGQGAG